MEKLIFRESHPLWIPFVLGYGVIWAYMILVNYRRGKPVEDQQMKNRSGAKTLRAAGFLPTVALFIISFFLEIQSRRLTWLGLILFISGILINIAALTSFSHIRDGVNTTGIYRLSRNPMYVGAFLFFTGLHYMAWESVVLNYLFLGCFFVWIAATHWVVLQEERFLTEKYGADFINYKNRVRRYF